MTPSHTRTRSFNVSQNKTKQKQARNALYTLLRRHEYGKVDKNSIVVFTATRIGQRNSTRLPCNCNTSKDRKRNHREREIEDQDPSSIAVNAQGYMKGKKIEKKQSMEPPPHIPCTPYT